MKILVTGATGFIGRHLCEQLAANKHEVVAQYRSEAKIPSPRNPAIYYTKADLTDSQSLRKAMNDCDQIYHLAAFAGVCSPDPLYYKKVIYDATINLLELAIEAGIKKIVVCSTAGVFGPSETGRDVKEVTKRSVDYFSDYERYKDLVDEEIMRNYSSRMEVVIVCPSRVFGPGVLSESNAVTKMIAAYLKGKFRFMPGDGSALGNYIYVEDVAAGMILAMENGKSGERYLLTGDNVNYREFFNMVGKVSGKHYRMLCVPNRLIIALATLQFALARLTGRKPVLPPSWARKYLYNWAVSNKKAVKELGFSPRSVYSAIGATIEWLNYYGETQQSN